MAKKSAERRGGAGGQLGKSVKVPKRLVGPSTPRMSSPPEAPSWGSRLGAAASGAGKRTVEVISRAPNILVPENIRLVGSFRGSKEFIRSPDAGQKVEASGYAINKNGLRGELIVDEYLGVGLMINDQSADRETVRDSGSHGRTMISESVARGFHESISAHESVEKPELIDAIVAGYKALDAEVRARTPDGELGQVTSGEEYGFDAVAFEDDKAVLTYTGEGMVYRFRGGTVEDVKVDNSPESFNRYSQPPIRQKEIDIEDNDLVIVVSPPVSAFLNTVEIAAIITKAQGDPSVTSEEISRQIAEAAEVLQIQQLQQQQGQKNPQPNLAKKDLAVMVMRKPTPEKASAPQQVVDGSIIDPKWKEGRRNRRMSSEPHQVVAQSISRERKAHLQDQQSYWFTNAKLGARVEKMTQEDLNSLQDVLTAYDLHFEEKWQKNPERMANVREVMRRYLAGQLPSNPQEQATAYVFLSMIERELLEGESEFARQYSSHGMSELDKRGEVTLGAVMKARDVLFGNLTGVEIGKGLATQSQLEKERKDKSLFVRIFRVVADRIKLDVSRDKRADEYKKHAKDFTVEGWLTDANVSLQTGDAFNATRQEVIEESEYLASGIVEKIADPAIQGEIEAFVTQTRTAFAPPAHVDERYAEIESSVRNAPNAEIKIKILNVEYLAQRCKTAKNLTSLHELVRAEGNQELIQVLDELDISPEEKLLEDLVMPKLDEAAKRIVIREELPADAKEVNTLLEKINDEIANTDPTNTAKLEDLRRRKAVMQEAINAIDSDVLIRAAKLPKPDLDSAHELFHLWGDDSIDEALMGYFGINPRASDAETQLKQRVDDGDLGGGFFFARIFAGLFGLSVRNEQKARQPKPQPNAQARGSQQRNRP